MSRLRDLNMINPTQSPIVTRFKSIYQGITLLINTRPGQLPFRPEFGVDLEDDLFEFVDELGGLDILNRISGKVEQFFPVVKVSFSRSSVKPKPGENAYDLVIKYTLPDISDEEFTFSGVLGN